jgi:hypothetical protein
MGLLRSQILEALNKKHANDYGKGYDAHKLGEHDIFVVIEFSLI